MDFQTQNQKQAQQFVLQTGCQHETQPELCLNTLSIKKKTPLRIPALIEHSTMDMVVPIAQSELLAEQFDASMLTWYTPKDSAVTHGFMEQEQATGFEEGMNYCMQWFQQQFFVTSASSLSTSTTPAPTSTY